MADPLAKSSNTARLTGLVAAILAAALATFAVGYGVGSSRGDDGVHAMMSDATANGPGAMMSGGMMSGGMMSGGMMSGGMMSGDEGEYLVEMIAHHEEAVTAATELSRSDRPEMRQLGRAIVTSQTAQIAQMESWLDQWHDDADQASYEPMMRDLDALTGDELDRTFLEDMVMHHMMAVMMSRQLLTGSVELHPEVADLARDIIREQVAEIRQMRGWLADWFGVRGMMTHRW